ncbi:PH domain-containing protein [Litorimonas sp. WD9-15]|uniref:PH domain-containing protein n=1 Tax=Litorimonas sp. WD9-15 TaxID=3418716 RepID=UPI003CFEDB4E
MNIYRSKIDLWLIAVLGGSILLPLILFIFLGGPLWLIIVILAPMAGFIIWLYLATRYEIRETDLIIHGGLFKIEMSRNSIISIRKSRNPLSSPAFSLDRLEIKYGANKMVLISPKDEAGFLDALGWSGRLSPPD